MTLRQFRDTVIRIAKSDLSKNPEFLTLPELHQKNSILMFATGYMHAIQNPEEFEIELAKTIKNEQ